MSVRAKFKCDTVSPKDAEGSVQTVTLSPVYGESEENKQFFRWTPSGQITMGTINASAANYFEPGKEYYIDFTRTE